MLSAHKSIDDIPVSPFLLKITLLSSMGIFMDGYVLTIYSIAIIYMKNYFHLYSGTPFYVYYIAFMGSSLFLNCLFQRMAVHLFLFLLNCLLHLKIPLPYHICPCWSTRMGFQANFFSIK